MGEKPTAAFVLSLIAGIFYIIIGLVQLAIGAIVSIFPIASGFFAILGGLGIISGILMIVGAAWISGGEASKVKTGSILVLVFSIVGILSSALIFFILGLVGAILGLTWKPPMKAPPPAPPHELRSLGQ